MYGLIKPISSSRNDTGKSLKRPNENTPKDILICVVYLSCFFRNTLKVPF